MQNSDIEALGQIEDAIVRIEISLPIQRNQIENLSSALSTSRAVLASMDAAMEELHARRMAIFARMDHGAG